MKQQSKSSVVERILQVKWELRGHLTLLAFRKNLVWFPREVFLSVVLMEA